MFMKQAVVILPMVLLAGPASATHNAPLSAPELAAQLGDENAPYILDVRSEREFESGHVPGAKHIHYKALSSRLSELGVAKDEEIVVYCEVGGRAQVANNILESAGYTEVRNLKGHMRNWRSGDFPVE